MTQRRKRGMSRDELRSQLVCPVCFEYMLPPIRQCINGHSLCNLCYDLLKDCNRCGGELIDKRNADLEKLAATLKSPCKNCSIEITLLELQDHEKMCETYNVFCVVGHMYGNCTWSGLPKEELQHYLTTHSDLLWTGQKINCTVRLQETDDFKQEFHLLKFVDTVYPVTLDFDKDSQCLTWKVCDITYSYRVEFCSEGRNKLFAGKKIDDEKSGHSLISVPLEAIEKFAKDDGTVYDYIFVTSMLSSSRESMEVEEEEEASAQKKSCVARAKDGFLSAYTAAKQKITRIWIFE